jgi:hypothetical protein
MKHLELLAVLQEAAVKLRQLARERSSSLSPELLRMADEIAADAATLEAELLDAGLLDAGLASQKAAHLNQRFALSGCDHQARAPGVTPRL